MAAILIVDDQSSERKFLADQLGSHDHKLTEAGDDVGFDMRPSITV